ncbi:MAG: hypothetical protein ACRC28_10585 [Clostridium sp.]|uniref:hypothetical protein n=1 Tax=Clostridium sp. TaxID=1506 RepID=UPI003F316589
MKKIIIGIVVAVIVVGAGFYMYTNRTASAEEGFKTFIGDINKFQLSGAENYIEQNGDISKGITEINNSDMTRQQALKTWFSLIKVNVVKAKKEDGDVVLEVQFFSPNGQKIASDFQYNVNGLDINNQTIEDSNANGDYLGSQISTAFLNAVEGNMTNIVQTDINVKMKKTISGWKIVNDDDVIKGLLGGTRAEDILN